MGKMEISCGKSTKWSGLWWHPEYQYFCSGTFPASELANLKGNLRLIVKKNKFYQKGKMRPNYNFTIRELESNKELELKTKDHDIEWYKNRLTELTEENKRLKEENKNLKGSN